MQYITFPCEIVNIDDNYVDIKYYQNDPETGELDEAYFAVGRIPMDMLEKKPAKNAKSVSVEHATITDIVANFEASKQSSQEADEEELGEK